MSADHRLREILEEFGAPREPTAGQKERARSRLHQAMRAAEPSRPISRRGRTLGWAAGAVAAVVIAAVVIVPGTARPVDANLAEIARVARTVSADELPAGSYVYVHSENRNRNFLTLESGEEFSYILPTATDLWARPTAEQEVTTTGEPEFADAADVATYEALGLRASDGVGETTLTPLDDIPNRAMIDELATDRDALRDQIYAQLSVDPEWTPQDEPRIFQHVAELMDPRFNAPPGLRAALLEILGELEVATQKTATGGVIVSIEYQDESGSWLEELEFDRDGHLRVERQTLTRASSASAPLPALFAESVHSRPTVVDAVGVFP